MTRVAPPTPLACPEKLNYLNVLLRLSETGRANGYLRMKAVMNANRSRDFYTAFSFLLHFISGFCLAVNAISIRPAD